MTIPEVHTEVQYAWTNSYSPAATNRALESIVDEPVPYKISHLVARLCFRGTYFPQKGALAWVNLENRSAIFRIIRGSFKNWRGSAAEGVRLEFDAGDANPCERWRQHTTGVCHEISPRAKVLGVGITRLHQGFRAVCAQTGSAWTENAGSDMHCRWH